jgi:DNA replication protein DnaC
VTTTRLCEWCGAQTDRPYYCTDACGIAARAARGAKRAEQWADEWVPRAYRLSDVQKLPDREAAELVINFDPWAQDEGAVGPYAYGGSGTGKTRSMILLCRNLVAQFNDLRFMRAKQFAEEVVERTRPNGKGGFSDWFAGLREADVLALDDLDKLDLTPRVAAELFELIEYRTSNELATLYTAQCNLERLAVKMAKKAKEETAGIIRRIRETSVPIHFSLP